VFAALSGIAPPVTRESVIAADPDVILAAGETDDQAWTNNWQMWQHMSAVRLGNLYTVDRNLITRPGPRILAGAQSVCEALEHARASGARD
jgi:iron complex transport system substrate-binding protein